MKKKHLFALVSSVFGSLASMYDLNVVRLIITVIANSAFWIGLLQIDHMWWKKVDYGWACETLWIPELGISWKDSFIMFCGLMIFGFYLFFGLMLL